MSADSPIVPPIAVSHMSDKCPLNKTVLTTDSGMTRSEINSVFSVLKWTLGIMCVIGLPVLGGSFALALSAQMAASEATHGLDVQVETYAQTAKHLDATLKNLAAQQAEWRAEQRSDMRNLNDKMDGLKDK